MTKSNEASSARYANQHSLLGDLNEDEKEHIYRQARHRAGAKLSVYIHVVVFVLVMALLTAINLTTTPQTLWIIWPLMGWGLGLAIHAVIGMRLADTYRAIEEKEIERALERAG